VVGRPSLQQGRNDDVVVTSEDVSPEKAGTTTFGEYCKASSRGEGFCLFLFLSLLQGGEEGEEEKESGG
jgi:hypothetical protein